MAANVCSDTNDSNTINDSYHDEKSTCTEPVTELSELLIPKLEISSSCISKEDIKSAQEEPTHSVDTENETDGHQTLDSGYNTKFNVNTPSNDEVAASKADPLMSDSITSSMAETDAVPFDISSKPNLETCSKSSGATKSSLTELASSKATNSPVDEDDAGPFNQNGYRQHLKGGNLCYETLTNKDSPYYNINEGRKLALIINHENFNHYDHQNIPRRTGTRRVSCCSSIIKYSNQFDLPHIKNQTFQVS